MNTITRNIEPIKVGFPTNSRLAEDCKPIADLLELEAANDGTLKSSLMPEAQFFPLRVNTIARYLCNKIFELGVIGDDTAVENKLDVTAAPPSEAREQITFLRPSKGGIVRDNIAPMKRVFSLGGLPSADFSLLERLDAPQGSTEGFLQGNRCRIATSYPRLTRRILFPNGIFPRTVIEKNDGQNERLLRAMPERFDLATDIVRTGETARKFGLSAKVLMKSRPGLWRSIYWGDTDRDRRVTDIAEQLRERLRGLLA